jgi:hypothetical protein
MNEITVTLHTGEHCIETSAKIEFRRLTGILLQSDAGRTYHDLEKQFELLHHFLTDSDFNSLRGSDDRLAGITPAECIIIYDSNGNAVVEIPD